MGQNRKKVHFTIHKQSRHKQKLTSTHSYTHIGKPTHTPQGLTDKGGVIHLPLPQGCVDKASELKEGPASVCPAPCINKHCGEPSHMSQRTSLISTMRTECLLGEGLEGYIRSVPGGLVASQRQGL